MTERYRDIIERIREIPEEKALGAPYEDYFSQVAHFILLLDAFLKVRFGRREDGTAGVGDGDVRRRADDAGKEPGSAFR